MANPYPTGTFTLLDTPSLLGAITTELTISAWIKADSAPSGYAGVVSKDHRGGWGGAPWVFQLGYGKMMFEYRYAAGSGDSNYKRRYADTPLPLNSWNHVVVTFKNGEITHYINGNPDGSQQYSQTSMITTDYPVIIGRGINYYFDGLVDDVHIYDRALSAEEVEGLYYPEIYTYNAANQLISDSAHTYTYDSFGNMTSNGAYNFTWDAKNRLIKITKVSDGSIIVEYTYDADGRRISKTNYYWSDNFSDGNYNDWTVSSGTWAVESGQLSGKGAGGGVDAWIYRGDSNWTNYRFKTKIIFDGSGGTTGSGSLVFRSTGHWQNEYRLDVWSQSSSQYPNRIDLFRYKNGASTALYDSTCSVAIQNPCQVEVEIIGNRIRVFIDGTNVIDIIDSDPLNNSKVGLGVVWDWHAHFDDVEVIRETIYYRYNDITKMLIAETNQGGDIVRNYTTTTDEYGDLISVTIDDITYYYLYDGMGQIAGLLDASGSLVVKYTYDGFGNPKEYVWESGDWQEQPAGTFGNYYLYKGYYYDTETGLYYLNARYYDPVAGRFISRDLVPNDAKDRIGQNPYLYCNNNPVNADDPSGLKSYYWRYRHYNWLAGKSKGKQKKEYKKLREKYREKYLNLSDNERKWQKNSYWSKMNKRKAKSLPKGSKKRKQLSKKAAGQKAKAKTARIAIEKARSSGKRKSFVNRNIERTKFLASHSLSKPSLLGVAEAYGGEEHKRITYIVAKQAGFSEEESKVIAEGSYWADDLYTVGQEEHFNSNWRGRDSRLIASERYLQAAIQLDGDLNMLGWACHPVQDRDNPYHKSIAYHLTMSAIGYFTKTNENKVSREVMRKTEQDTLMIMLRYRQELELD